MLKCIQKGLTIRVVFKHGLLLIAPGSNMIHCAGVLNTEGAGLYERRLSEIPRNVKPQDLYNHIKGTSRAYQN